MNTSPSDELCSIAAPFRLRIRPVFLKTSTTHQVMCESSPPPLPNRASEPAMTRHGKSQSAIRSARIAGDGETLTDESELTTLFSNNRAPQLPIVYRLTPTST